MGYSRDEVAALIDHTLLKPEASVAGVRDLVSEAKSLGAHSVCVSPSMLPLPDDIVLGRLKLAAVCGFPSGAHHSEVKAAEAARSVAEGADEVDMVVNLAWEATGRFDRVEEDIRAVREAVPGAVLKAIIESAALTDEQIAAAEKAGDRATAMRRSGLREDLDGLPPGGRGLRPRGCTHAAHGRRRPRRQGVRRHPRREVRRGASGGGRHEARPVLFGESPRHALTRASADFAVAARSRSRGTPDLRPRHAAPVSRRGTVSVPVSAAVASLSEARAAGRRGGGSSRSPGGPGPRGVQSSSLRAAATSSLRRSRRWEAAALAASSPSGESTGARTSR